MVLLAKILSPVLGVTSEAIHAARESSSSRKQATSTSPDSSVTDNVELEARADKPNDNGIIDQNDEKREIEVDIAEFDYVNGFDQDEAVWEFDEIADSMRTTNNDDTALEERESIVEETEDVKLNEREALVRDLVALAGPPPPQPIQRLPCPVIIPQRRPRKRERGFVRAYAPVLADSGVSEDVFLEFLEDFDRVSKASAWIEVIQIAGGVLGFVPILAAQITSAVVQVVAGTARELQKRHRKNSFLDRVNQEIFMPRGLYAMVMAFKNAVPGQQQQQGSLFSKERLDLNQTVEKFRDPDPNMTKFKKGMNDIRLVSGKTRGEIELPEAAALIYPDLNRVVLEEGEGLAKIRDKLRNAGEWYNDYSDRKAHAFFVGFPLPLLLLCWTIWQITNELKEAKHEGSALVIPSEQRKPLKSRFNDPNHPANSGSLISILTGGHIPVPGVDKMMAETQQLVETGIKRLVKGKSSVEEEGESNGQPPELITRWIIKKVLQEDVLYLVVVNLPSQEEVEESVAKLESIAKEVEAASSE